MASAAEVITSAQALIADLRSRLLESSATAGRAESEVTEGLSQFERGAALLAFEVQRQKAAKDARERSKVERENAEAARKQREEHARHARVLKAEAVRTKALEAAKTYVKDLQATRKAT